jgi:O-antigen biosynthesis protein
MPSNSFSSALILAGCLHATVKLYRCTHLQEQLQALGIQAEVQDWVDQAFPADSVQRHDLLILQRTAITANLTRLIDQMHSQGKTVLFDTDDLIFEPTMTTWHRGAARLAPDEQAEYATGVRRTLATLEASDGVLTATPLLAKLAARHGDRHGKPAFVHRNAVGQAMQTLGNQLYAARQRTTQADSTRRDKVIIGYGSGTPTHDVDFAEAVPALLDILARHPHVELWLMGPLVLPPALALFAGRIQRHPLLDWPAYLALAAQLDIALAPLERGNLFCRAKSEIKFVEAGLLGIPTVATRIDPFVHAIDHGQDGLLAGNSAEWIDALETLITQPDLRRALGDAARRKVEQRYSPAARTADLAQTLDQLSATRPQLSTNIPPALRAAAAEAPSPTLSKIQNPKSEIPAVPLVLNWIVSEPFRGSGGHLGIFRMIQHLVAFGHECHVYIVPFETMQNYSAEELRRFVDEYFMPTGAHFHRWTGRIYDGDATFATYWSTAHDVLGLANAGRRYYLVQDFEPWFYPMGSDYLRAEQTYRLGLHCITLGPWLAKLLRTQYGATAHPFDFAVDPEIYWPQPLPRPTHPRLAFYARPSTARRGFELAVEALTLVKRRYPEVEIIFFGANELPPLPFTINHQGVRSPWELATLYSTCDVGLVLSLTNPSFVPFEMMACKCPVVDLKSERVTGLLTDRQTALLADPTPEDIAEKVLELLWDRELRTTIAEQGYAQVKSMSWTASARQIEAILLEHAPPPAERRLARRVENYDADSLLWQIHQILDQHQDAAREVAQLERLLQRTLADKAQLAERLRRLEQTAPQRPSHQLVTSLRQTSAQALGQMPVWVLGQQRLNQLPVGSAPVQQHFVATASQLCAVDLLFVAHPPPAGRALRFTVHDLTRPDSPIFERTVATSTLETAHPYRLDFPAQPYSNGRAYRLTVSLEGGGEAGLALWRYWNPVQPESQLQQGGQPIRGQLVYQVHYQTETQAALAASQPVANQPTPLTTVARQGSQRAWQESARLTSKASQAIRRQGLRGLLKEISAYVRWRLNP